MELQIDSIYVIKDSIKTEIKTVYKTIEKNNKEYEKNVVHIVNNNTNEDCMFFHNYIDANKTRLDSLLLKYEKINIK